MKLLITNLNGTSTLGLDALLDNNSIDIEIVNTHNKTMIILQQKLTGIGNPSELSSIYNSLVKEPTNSIVQLMSIDASTQTENVVATVEGTINVSLVRNIFNLQSEDIRLTITN